MSIPRKTVKDKATMKEVVLTDEELDIINRIQNAKFPGTDYDPYEVSSVKLQFSLQIMEPVIQSYCNYLSLST